MSYTLLPVVDPADVPELASILHRAMRNDIFINCLKGTMTYEEEAVFFRQFSCLDARLGPGKGIETGESGVWKVVDEEGKAVGWTGLGYPVADASKGQASAAAASYSGINESVRSFFATNVWPSLTRNSYDPTKHCIRQMLMVDPLYHGKGIGRMLVQHTNALADERNAPTFVRARPGAAALLRKMGFEVLERIDLNLADHGAEGKTQFWAMKRPAGALNDKKAVLE